MWITISGFAVFLLLLYIWIVTMLRIHLQDVMYIIGGVKISSLPTIASKVINQLNITFINNNNISDFATVTLIPTTYYFIASSFFSIIRKDPV